MAAWAITSVFGLHAVLRAFEGLAAVVRLAGAAYLTYIGARLLWVAWNGERSDAHAAAPRSIPDAFRHGLLTNLANPKALALFGSLFAVLVPPDAPPLVQPRVPDRRHSHDGRVVHAGRRHDVQRRHRPGLPPRRAGHQRRHRCVVFVAVGARLAAEQ